MIIFPAIDLKEGRCVRLLKGDMNAVTIFNDNPLEQAMEFQDLGFKFLHVVDLDGAVLGFSKNQKIIEQIVSKTNLKIQLGGGIRSIENIQSWINSGVSKIILGTMAINDPDQVIEACKKFPQQIILGIDAKNYYVSGNGWVKDTKITVIDLASKFVGNQIASIIYTDINRDGTLQGCDFEGSKKLAKAVNIPVIVSGGVSSINDLDKISDLNNDGVIGAIIGRSWYEKKININQIKKYL